MQRFGKPEMFLLVFGDWETVISVREYRDGLLDQKPDADDADYSQFRIPCATSRELFAAIDKFRAARLECHVGFSFKSEDRAVSAYTHSGSGYGGKDEPYCQVETKVDETKLGDAVRDSIRILKDAIK